jgi:ABC-type antimicrobial peptide transport system permease subunit
MIIGRLDKDEQYEVVPLTSRGLSLLKQWREESPYRKRMTSSSLEPKG